MGTQIIVMVKVSNNGKHLWPWNFDSLNMRIFLNYKITWNSVHQKSLVHVYNFQTCTTVFDLWIDFDIFLFNLLICQSFNIDAFPQFFLILIFFYTKSTLLFYVWDMLTKNLNYINWKYRFITLYIMLFFLKKSITIICWFKP